MTPLDEAHTAHFHAVRFYDSPESLADIVAPFLGVGFITHEPAIVIARPRHCAAIAAALRSVSFSVESLQASGALLLLDAEKTLELFMLNGSPDPVRFETVTRAAADAVSTPHSRPVRWFDEMVDVLWRRNERAAAVRLETLWQRLTSTRRCSLLCGHAADRGRPNDAAHAICTHHSHVIAGNGLPHPLTMF